MEALEHTHKAKGGSKHLQSEHGSSKTGGGDSSIQETWGAGDPQQKQEILPQSKTEGENRLLIHPCSVA